MAEKKISSRLFFLSLSLVFFVSFGISTRAHEEDESCDDACKAARYEKIKQWKAEHGGGKESGDQEKDQSGDDEADQAENDHDDDHEGKWTEEERAAWREKWKNFDYSKYKSKHGDPGHVCRRGMKKARAQITQIDKATTNLVKDQLDAVAEARDAVGNTSDISGAAPAERAAFAVKVRRDIDRIEDKIVKGRPVSRKEIARIPNPGVRQKLMKALDAQTKVETLEVERAQTVKTMKALEKMAEATVKAEADMSSLQKISVDKEKRPESGKAVSLAEKGGQSGTAASPAENGMGEKFDGADSNRNQSARSKLREALRQRMLAREGEGDADTEILFDGHLNMAPPKDDYVAFTGELPKKTANPDLISLDVFQPIKTGKSLAGPETEAEVKRISLEVAGLQSAGGEPASASPGRAPAAESTAEEPRYLDAAILSRQSLSLFERVKHCHEACLLRKCVSVFEKKGLRAAH